MIPMGRAGEPIPENLPASVPHEASFVKGAVFEEELVSKTSIADYKCPDGADTDFHQIAA
jgi:hypothetical protein